MPPATSTRPSFNTVLVCHWRACTMAAAARKLTNSEEGKETVYLPTLEGT